MQQVAAILKDTGHADKDIVIFSWMKTCQGERERVYAALRAAEAVSVGKYATGDLVTVGYNAGADMVIMAAAGKTRFSHKVVSEVAEAEEDLGKLGWKIHRVEVPDDAPGKFQKSPWDWELECLSVQRVLR